MASPPAPPRTMLLPAPTASWSPAPISVVRDLMLVRMPVALHPAWPLSPRTMSSPVPEVTLSPPAPAKTMLSPSPAAMLSPAPMSVLMERAL